jgi:hypothetical protein
MDGDWDSRCGADKPAGGVLASKNLNERDAIWMVFLVFPKHRQNVKQPVRYHDGLDATHFEDRGTREPLLAHAPSIQAPFLPRTHITKLSTSSSYSIRA